LSVNNRFSFLVYLIPGRPVASKIQRNKIQAKNKRQEKKALMKAEFGAGSW